jgi:hypothetical protein
MPEQSKELFVNYYLSTRRAEEIIAQGNIRHVVITRRASQKALKLLDANQISHAIIINYSQIPQVGAKPLRLINSVISHEQIVHSLASALSKSGFPARIKDFYNPGADLTCEIEDFQAPRFWEHLRTLKNNFTKKDEANNQD